MQEESRGVYNFTVNVGLPMIFKKTMKLKRTNKLQEFSVEWDVEIKIMTTSTLRCVS
jgi:hypothetical protein